MEYPNAFYYKGIRFDRQRHLECHSFIYANHIYFAKWDEPLHAHDFKDYYNFITNDCEPSDLKYFVNTRRIVVKDVKGWGYGYLQDKLSYNVPRCFDIDKYTKIVNGLQKKYSIEDFSLYSDGGHNIGFLNGEMKIFDIGIDD